jgi:hypothetical protein
MENAIKAFYMAAGLLIALMVISAGVYVFRNGARLGATYESTVSTEQVSKFNSQFEVYGKKTNQTTEAAQGYSFVEKGNTASDIITCANLAMSINSQNEYDMQNAVEVVVVIDSHTKYYVYPIENQPKNSFIKSLNLETAKTTSSFTGTNSLDFYEFLKEYTQVRIVDVSSTEYNSTSETIYKYYFDVDADENGVANQGLTYSDVTGKITKIVFTINPTEHFDDTTWTDAR